VPLTDERPIVLVIDDDVAVRSLAGLTLGRAGYEVRQAESIAAARSLVDGVHVCLCDLRLPDGSGLDFVASLGEQTATAAVVCVMISGSPDVDSRQRGDLPNIAAWLTKPFGIETLISTVSAALERGGARTDGG
jgi:DNA-binding response OmpR family regulator